jgi:hypothetical protein
MNDTDSYRMNPVEDTLVYGEDLKEGMWVLAESPRQRTPYHGTSVKDSMIRTQRFRQVSRLRREPASAVKGATELIHFTGTWIDGYQASHTASPGQPWIVKKAPEDPEVTADAEVIARVCASGYNEHVRLNGPDGDKATGTAGGTFTVMRNGRAYTVTVTPSAGEG